MWDTIFYDCKPMFTSVDTTFVAIPPLPRTSLLSTAVKRQTADDRSCGFPTPVVTFLREIDHASVQLEILLSPETENTYSPQLVCDRLVIKQGLIALCHPEKPSEDLSHTDYVIESCRLAAKIYWRSLFNRIPFSAAENQPDVHSLQAVLSQTSETYWLQNAPGIHLWGTLIGAFAATTMPRRTWFISRAGPITMALGPEEEDTFKKDFAHIRWIRDCLRQRNNPGPYQQR